jgi:microcystin-dependent protein
VNYGVVVQGRFPIMGAGVAQNQLIGQIVTYSGALPAGVLPADGRTLPINQNQALFSILGTSFGGDGRVTFSLPNLQGRDPTGVGTAPGLSSEFLGQQSGADQVTLTTGNLPPNHITLGNGQVATFGGGASFSVMQPTLGLEPIIALTGAFPSPGVDTGDQPFLGEISWFAGTNAPAGWAFADGQLLPISQFPLLISILGASFGGNGFSNFALPNLIDRIAVGTGNGIMLGSVFGRDFDTLSFAQLPVGYPTNLPRMTPVSEPPAVGCMLTGLVAVVLLRACAHARTGERARCLLGRVLSDHRRALFGDHDGRCIGVARGQRRHDRCIDHPQVRDPVHAETRIDYRTRALAHATRADRMEDRRTEPA